MRLGGPDASQRQAVLRLLGGVWTPQRGPWLAGDVFAEPLGWGAAAHVSWSLRGGAASPPSPVCVSGRFYSGAAWLTCWPLVDVLRNVLENWQEPKETIVSVGFRMRPVFVTEGAGHAERGSERGADPASKIAWRAGRLCCVGHAFLPCCFVPRAGKVGTVDRFVTEPSFSTFP